MSKPAANTETTQPDPATNQPFLSKPSRLGFVLYVVQVLLGYGRHLSDTITTCATKPQFPIAAAAFGTHNLAHIAARIERGILRAIALERYLLERAAKGRDLKTTPDNRPRPMLAEEWLAKWAAEEAAEQAARAAEAARLAESRQAREAARLAETAPQADPAPQAQPERTRTPGKRRNDRDDTHLPTLEEIEAEVRRIPIGRTIVKICDELGVVVGFCDGGFWNDLYDAFRWHGGSLDALWEVWQHRQDTFEKERDKRPASWDCDWRSYSKDTVRELIGCLIGEPPPRPAIVPS